MKTIGLLGGMSWESTAHYYRLINKGIRSRLGGLHSASLVMYSVDFHGLEQLMKKNDWPAIENELTSFARRVERGGADFLLICTNTMHKAAPAIQEAVSIPLLHLADATARKIQTAGLTKIGLLGTRFTMEEEFYRGRLIKEHGLEVLIPDKSDREIVDRIIFDELCRGEVLPDSKSEYLRIIRQLAEQGAEGIILGCTEIGMLVQPADTPTPLFDTTEIHAGAAVEMALE